MAKKQPGFIPAVFPFFSIFSSFAVIRQFFFHNCPETRRMIHFFTMCQFVDNHIIKKFRWHQYQLPVEVKISRRAAASPTGFLFPDRDSVIGNSHPFCKICSTFRKDLFCLQNSFLTLFVCDHMHILTIFLQFLLLYKYPRFVIFYKFRNPVFRQPDRCPYDNTSIWFYLNRQCLSVGTYQFIFYQIFIISDMMQPPDAPQSITSCICPVPA